MQQTHGHTKDPQSLIASFGAGLHHLTFDHTASYAGGETGQLQVLLLNKNDTQLVSVFIDDQFEFTPGDSPEQRFGALTREHPVLDLTQPWPLETVRIPKPWGAEIWYTGIEARGVCTAAGIPLPWLMDLLPPSMTGSAHPAPLLLKILDPLPNGSLGDLYFELHEKKIEVYIVTAVDQQVWPNGIGKIRYGFNQQVREEFGDDTAFKAAYLDAVHRYQSIRHTIDQHIDGLRVATGYAPNQEIPADLMGSWLADLPAGLTEQEKLARDNMYRFTHLRDIEVGDVITVEPFFPHSLQHGVRVVEFQTASYERHILSFGQKVLTQDHWDTELALSLASLDLPEEQAPTIVSETDGYKIEQVADFTAFSAERITLRPGHGVELPFKDYQLLIGVSGAALLNGTYLAPESAALLPANISGHLLCDKNEDQSAVVLVAKPK